ncbi:MAG: hypothetical protein RMJ17_03590 [Candidatus Aenigmarchaeota archaeon]|nr:hypothetical protein [Candidatus Aenigmarchaeota archaeon]MDW8149646.1 hypothetical protein [Candidatus Aenigmarchaeota archaeon]
MKKLTVFTIVVILTVFLAGCISAPGGTRGGIGVVIKEFKVEPTAIEARDDQRVFLSLTIQNNGGAMATNIKTNFIVGSDFVPPSGSIDNIPSSLPPANPALGIREGGVGHGTKEIIYRGGQKTNTLSYPILLRLSYDYSTVIDGIVKIVTPEYFRQTKETGGILQFSQSEGPIQAQLAVPVSVIGHGSEIRVHLRLRDVGGGRSYVGDINAGLGLVRISSSGCIFPTSTVFIPQGGETVATCTIQPLAAGELFTTKSFKITIDYSYFIDLHSSITVLPTS